MRCSCTEPGYTDFGSFLPNLWSNSFAFYGPIMFALFLHKNKMKISLVTMPPLLIFPAWLLFKSRPVSNPDYICSLLEGVHSIAARWRTAFQARQKPAAPSSHQFPTDSAMPEVGKGFSAEKCNFLSPGMMGWPQTSFAVGRDKAGSSWCPDYFPHLIFARFLLGSPACSVFLE